MVLFICFEVDVNTAYTWPCLFLMLIMVGVMVCLHLVLLYLVIVYFCGGG